MDDKLSSSRSRVEQEVIQIKEYVWRRLDYGGTESFFNSFWAHALIFIDDCTTKIVSTVKKKKKNYHRHILVYIDL